MGRRSAFHKAAWARPGAAARAAEASAREGLISKREAMEIRRACSVRTRKATGTPLTLPGVGAMSVLEREYAEELNRRYLAGEIQNQAVFASVKLFIPPVGPQEYYVPSFLVFSSKGEVEFHEVRNEWGDSARHALHTAAALYPRFRFLAVARNGDGGWKQESV
jgi:hypothetical protein